MRLNTRRITIALAMGFPFLGILSSAASAASISYGNFGPVPPGVTYLNVIESSGTDPVPLYGPPTALPGQLSFMPTSFAASGASGAGDLTDGQLNFTVMSPGLTSIGVSEGGDYTLAGVGTAATQVFAGASLRVTVTQLNGVNIAPIVLASSNASIGRNLIANPGVLQPWSVGTSVNVTSQLATLGYGPGQKATKADIVVDNQLVALSEPLSTAHIAKTAFSIDVHTFVPEPSTAALAGLALCGACMSLSRKRR
jgi:hypothetical protein